MTMVLPHPDWSSQVGQEESCPSLLNLYLPRICSPSKISGSFVPGVYSPSPFSSRTSRGSNLYKFSVGMVLEVKGVGVSPGFVSTEDVF